MLRPRTYYIIEVENLETGEITHVTDRYGHGPERFYDFNDAAKRVARLNGQMRHTEFRARYVERQAEDKPRKTRLVQ